MKKLLTIVILLIAGIGIKYAVADDSPLALAQNTSQQMIQALNANRASIEQDSSKIYDLVQEILLPHFDFKTMSQWVLGKYWRQASPTQREQFIDDFRTLLVNTYSKALLEYSNERIEFLPLGSAQSDDVTVRSEVHVRGSQPIPINYSMHRKDGSWKIYDVTVEGVSLVTNYRGTIGTLVRNEGMNGMLQKLRAGNI